MSSTEESPAQKSARLRRERREAKIRDGGAARLDKITSLSGRTPASVHEETAAAPATAPNAAHEAPTPTFPVQPQPQPQPAIPPFPTAEDQSPEALRAQQEYIRALLRQRTPDPTIPQLPQQQQGGMPDQDPTMQLLNSLLGGAGGGAGAGMPSGLFGGAGAGPGSESGAGPTPPSLADLASMFGLPPWLAQILKATTTTAQPEAGIQRWKILHVLFSVCMAVYLLMLVGSSVATYGSPPPPPAMAQNPWVMFLTGELVLGGARLLNLRGAGTGAGNIAVGIQVVRDIVRDGSILVFVFGLASWWNRGWQQTL